MAKNIYFFIGTEAELIKVFPVIIECQKKGAVCNIIASGQNDIANSRIMKFISLNGKFVELSKEESITKSAVGLLKWFAATRRNAVGMITSNFNEDDLKGEALIVHGDTVSTMMGAMIGRKLGMCICHVEAGLRSHNLLNPFPEEIDRLVTSRLARVHFAPGSEPTGNLKKVKGKVVNTEYNTILDSLMYSQKIEIATEAVKDILDEDYFVFVMHRQENLMKNEFVGQVIAQIEKFAQKRKCVLILHKITENKLKELNILSRLEASGNFILLPRIDYFDFMKLLYNSQYVITDGGSNQEELHYMGKPCLIMRKTTERQEGIGSNAVMYSGNIECMSAFEENYIKYKRESIVNKFSPSKIICDVILSIKAG